MSQSIEKTLEHNIVKIKPVGYSMYPVIVPGRDYVYIEKADYGTLKRGDVILYKRPEPESIYVLHRIYKVKPDGVYTVGDNQRVCEGPLAREQILGKMIALDRKGRHINVTNVIYKLLTGIWLDMRKVRRPISLFVHDIKSRKCRHNKAALYKMAYSDDLTGLFNRRYCEEVLCAISNDNRNYIIYSFDLNNLKKINDTLGHQCGDCLISGYAAILKSTFPEGCVIGRMGGDEYIVIKDAEKMGQQDIDNDIKRLNDNVADYNDKEQRFAYSAAYGYALKTDVSGCDMHVDAHDVYSIADCRMYDMKRKMKETWN